MKITLTEIAERVGGTLRGDGALVIQGAAGLGEAEARKTFDSGFRGGARAPERARRSAPRRVQGGAR
jgi:hypothetical protein